MFSHSRPRQLLSHRLNFTLNFTVTWVWISGLALLVSIAGGPSTLCGPEVACAAEPAPAAQSQLVVHEWGTFTTLQDEHGRELPGINIDDEPVPAFVHNLAPFVLNSPLVVLRDWQYRMKGVPRQHPQVTMRLETPVVYFYPPAGAKLPLEVDVHVQFRGGWLSEFYPHGAAKLPGLNEHFAFKILSRETLGELTWEKLQIGVSGSGPETTERVWTTPRNVASAMLANSTGEREKYLFYRGVAHQRAPLAVAMKAEQRELSITANFDEALAADETATIAAAWLVSVEGPEKLAFRRIKLDRVNRDLERVIARASCEFSPSDYGADRRAELERVIHAALVADGLFADEAAALLGTWQRAYFEQRGLRLFYLVPSKWTNHYLPLSISSGAEITRVMMGRIELITDEQRRLLARIAAGPASDPRWIDTIPDEAVRQRLLAGRSDFGDPGVAIPADFQAYLDLGRFRTALVVAEERRRPTPALARFIDQHNLHLYRAPQRREEE